MLGRFVTLKEYFEHTDSYGAVSKFGVDQYRAPYLKQSIIRRRPNPLSSIANEHRWRKMAESAETLNCLTTLLGGGAAAAAASSTLERLDAGLAEGEPPLDTEEQISSETRAAAEAFAATLPTAQQEATNGYLLINPLSFTRRVGVETPELTIPPDLDDTVKAAQDSGRKLIVADVPAMGYAWITSGGGKPQKKEIPLADAESLSLRNEFMEVAVDQHTGAIRSLRDYRQRGNRLSQQLALRRPGPRQRPGDVWRDPDDMAEYSVMAADSVEVTLAGTAAGEIVSRGRLVDKEGQKLAAFTQTLRLLRGSRVLNLDIDLRVDEAPRADPWNSYYAARFAWSDAGAEMFRGVSMTCQPTDAKRVESPLFVEARSETCRTAILTGGLPYHRRVGMRMLDTMLVARGETCQTFRLGIGVDLPHVVQAAVELLSPVIALPRKSPPPAGAASGWLFHVDAKNLLATHWAPLQDEDGQVIGFQARLLETQGRSVRAKLRAYRSLGSAEQVDFLGNTLVQLPVEDDQILIDVAKFEWVDVQAVWAKP